MICVFLRIKSNPVKNRSMLNFVVSWKLNSKDKVTTAPSTKVNQAQFNEFPGNSLLKLLFFTAISFLFITLFLDFNFQLTAKLSIEQFLMGLLLTLEKTQIIYSLWSVLNVLIWIFLQKYQLSDLFYLKFWEPQFYLHDNQGNQKKSLYEKTWFISNL